MTSLLDVQLNETMRNYLHTFFLSLEGDSNALSSFVTTLSHFHNIIRVHHDKLQVETLSAIQGFASIIDSVSFSVLELAKENEKLRDETLVDISKILDDKLGKLTISDSNNPSSSKDGNSAHLPAYIRPSYEWLLSNLHNPYPSKEVKNSIAHRTKCSVRDIDSWFIDARKRIGWNALRREQFSNKQEKIIAAATRFFKPFPRTFSDDLTTSLESDADIDDRYCAKFTTMEDAARSLYSGRFIDIPPPIPPSHPSSRKPSLTTSIPTKKRDGGREPISFSQPIDAGSELYTEVSSPIPIHDSGLSYPTPEPSPGRSAELSPPASAPLSLPGEITTQFRKRRRTSVEPPEEEDNLTQPRKKSRPDTWESIDTADNTACSLPSPAPTIDFSDDTSEGDTQPTEPANCSALVVLASSSAKRKRRLSDGDSRRPAKRPHHALAVPRFQAVSDPFPNARPIADDYFDDWFNGNFSPEHRLSDVIPSSADLEVQDSPDDVPLDVHCHSYDIPPYQSHVALSETSFLAHAHDDGLISGTSIPDEVPKMSIHESLSISSSLPDIDATELMSAGEFSLALGFDFPSAVEQTISHDISRNLQTPIIDFDTLVNFSWMQLPVGDSIDLVDPPRSHMTETSSLSDFDSPILRSLIVPEDQDAKRLRLQFLREELKLLESEIGP